MTVFTLEQELESMIKNKDKFVKGMGEENYNRLLKKIKDAIEKKNKN